MTAPHAVKWSPWPAVIIVCWFVGLAFLVTGGGSALSIACFTVNTLCLGILIGALAAS